MALTRIDNPTPSAPAALADYVQILAVQMNAILQALRGNSHSAIDFSANVARAGVVFYVAGVLYKAVTDQAIGGTPSKYVKITPSGGTAAIAYVASLAGVNWSDDQSGYYDGSGNLYVFDEARAVYDGVVSAAKTVDGQKAYISGDLSIKNNLAVSGNETVAGFLVVSGSADVVGSLDVNGAIIADGGINENSVTIKRKVLNIGDWNMDTTVSVSIAHGLTYSTIRRISVLIRPDTGSGDALCSLDINFGTLSAGNFFINEATPTLLTLVREASGQFDSSAYNATSFNRGWIFIDYAV